jgi:hormone-sensitive lipase
VRVTMASFWCFIRCLLANGDNLRYYSVYKQIVQNKLLGCEPVSIVVCGDSAGGNLAMSMCLLAIKHGVRLPDGIVLAYPAIDLSRFVSDLSSRGCHRSLKFVLALLVCCRTATPSRIMFAHDVLLSYHLLDTCLKAYLGEKENEAGSNKLISPLLASDDELRALPDKICILSATYDPLLDDATRFIRVRFCLRCCGDYSL